MLIRGDLTETAKVKNLVQQCAKQFGRLDVLVNNAAAFSAHPAALDHRRAMAVADGYQPQGAVFSRPERRAVSEKSPRLHHQQHRYLRRPAARQPPGLLRLKSGAAVADQITGD